MKKHSASDEKRETTFRTNKLHQSMWLKWKDKRKCHWSISCQKSIIVLTISMVRQLKLVIFRIQRAFNSLTQQIFCLLIIHVWKYWCINILDCVVSTKKSLNSAHREFIRSVRRFQFKLNIFSVQFVLPSSNQITWQKRNGSLIIPR